MTRRGNFKEDLMPREVLSQNLFYSKRPLFVEEMERGRPAGAEIILLQGQCHPKAAQTVQPLTDGGPGIGVACIQCGAAIIALATEQTPGRSRACVCMAGVQAVYNFKLAAAEICCHRCGRTLETLPMRRGGAASEDAPPASIPLGHGGAS